VDAAVPKPDDLALTAASGQESAAGDYAVTPTSAVPQTLLLDLWMASEAEACGITVEEFGVILASIGAKHNHGLPPGAAADSRQKEAFFRSLHLAELALAHACALGREAAWARFIGLYRASLVHAAIAITSSASLGHDLADSLYAELYGLRQSEGERRSPLASYSGRGSLLSWLRTTLVQRFRDHHRRTHRETELDEFECPAPSPAPPFPTELNVLGIAVGQTLRGLPAEDRFLLSAYFLDRQTLLQIARTLHVHEATVSRRLKRLVSDTRKQLLINLQHGGLSKRAAEETLGADPRDLEINLRRLLQTSQIAPFPNQTAAPDRR
jgi:RNA polymerase sigma-70 factor (ECF subfamily)